MEIIKIPSFTKEEILEKFVNDSFCIDVSYNVTITCQNFIFPNSVLFEEELEDLVLKYFPDSRTVSIGLELQTLKKDEK